MFKVERTSTAVVARIGCASTGQHRESIRAITLKV